MIENVAQYKILERIGVGRMGDVFRARDTRVGRTVAIKLVPPEIANDPDRRARLIHRAHAAAALSHPSVAALYEIGEDAGHLFLASEFVPGNPIRTVIGGHPLNPRTAIQFAIQIADALAEAHAVGVVHGDMKPEDIVVTPKGTAKVLDFAVAQTTDRDADERDDIFSAGCALWEMLTGSVARQGKLPSGAGSGKLDAIVRKALETDREKGYQSAATFAADLRSIEIARDARAEPTEKPIASKASQAPGRRSYAGWLLVVALLTMAGAVWAWCGPLRAP